MRFNCYCCLATRFQLAILFIFFYQTSAVPEAFTCWLKHHTAAARKKAKKNIILILEAVKAHTPFVYLILKWTKSNRMLASVHICDEMFGCLFACASEQYNAYHLLRGVGFTYRSLSAACAYVPTIKLDKTNWIILAYVVHALWTNCHSTRPISRQFLVKPVFRKQFDFWHEHPLKFKNRKW